MDENRRLIAEINIPVVPIYRRVFGSISGSDEDINRVHTLTNVAAGRAFVGTKNYFLDNELDYFNPELHAQRTMRLWYLKPREIERPDITVALETADMKPVLNCLDACMDVLRLTRRRTLKNALNEALESGNHRNISIASHIIAHSQDPVMIDYLINRMLEYNTSTASELS